MDVTSTAHDGFGQLKLSQKLRLPILIGLACHGTVVTTQRSISASFGTFGTNVTKAQIYSKHVHIILC